MVSIQVDHLECVNAPDGCVGLVLCTKMHGRVPVHARACSVRVVIIRRPMNMEVFDE